MELQKEKKKETKKETKNINNDTQYIKGRKAQIANLLFTIIDRFNNPKK